MNYTWTTRHCHGNGFCQAVSSRFGDRECFGLLRLPSFSSDTEDERGGRLPPLSQADGHSLRLLDWGDRHWFRAIWLKAYQLPCFRVSMKKLHVLPILYALEIVKWLHQVNYWCSHFMMFNACHPLRLLDWGDRRSLIVIHSVPFDWK